MLPLTMLSGLGETSFGSVVDFLGTGPIPYGPTHESGSVPNVFGPLQTVPSADDGMRSWFNPARFRRLAYIARTTGKASYWLGEALRDLEEVAAGIEVDGPIPDKAVITAARDFLMSLSPRIATDPGVDHDGSGGVGVEFVGRSGDRILFIIENDVTASYHEYIRREGKSRRYDTWLHMIRDINDSWLRRAEIPMRDRPSLMHHTWRWSSRPKAATWSETVGLFR